MAQLHHRMPVVIHPDLAERWLDGDPELLSEVIENSPEFRAWPVDRRVNNARNGGAELIDRAGDMVS